MDLPVVLFLLGAVLVAVGLFFIVKNLLKIAILTVVVAAILFAGYWFAKSDDRISSSPAVKGIEEFVGKAADFGNGALQKGKEVKETVVPIVQTVKDLKEALPSGGSQPATEPAPSAQGKTPDAPAPGTAAEKAPRAVARPSSAGR